MATYISLFNYTEQGVKNFKDTRKRAAAFEAMAKKSGVSVKTVFWTMGRYDGVVILDAPDDQAVTTTLLQLAAAGNVHTTTLRAFNGEEIDAIIAKATR
jgi:uncharacterized protein with GYD domain